MAATNHTTRSMFRAAEWGLLQIVAVGAVFCIGHGAYAASVVTEYVRNAPGWRSAQPRYVGFAFDRAWPSSSNAFLGCTVTGTPNNNGPQTVQLVGGQVTVTSRDASNNPVCPFQDGTSSLRATDGYIPNGGSATIEFNPSISAFYANYGSLAVGQTCTMSLYSGANFVDAIVSAASTHSGHAAGHGFASPVLIDEIRITCTEAGTVLIGGFTGLVDTTDDNLRSVCVPAYDSNCSGPHTLIDFACVFEGNEITIPLPGSLGDPDDFIAIPRGRSVYALLVSGYSQNASFDLLHYFNFADYVLEQGGYVHYAWWNNLLAPYMERPLHLPQSQPGNLATELGGFVPKPGNDGHFSQKAEPEEDNQFQSDALRFVRAVHQNEPTALVVVVGHSMGGGSVSRLGSNVDSPIHILAPIDPVGNRSLPVGRVGYKDYNWTRWRAIHGEFNGFKDQDCDRNFLGFCKVPLDCFPIGSYRDEPPGLGTNWTLTAPTCGAYVHNPAARKLSSNVHNLLHRWQTEAAFPFDFNTNRYFNYTSSVGGKNDQKAVDTCALGQDPLDATISCGSADGHGEIVGFRHVPVNEDGLKATNWTSNATTRRQNLKDWETEGSSWGHRPTKPQRCMVSGDLITMLGGLISGSDAAVVSELERKAAQWKAEVPGRWEAYAFDQSWPGQGGSFAGCNVVGVPDATAPQVLQLAGGQITVSALDATSTLICPIRDGTSAESASEGYIVDDGKLVLEFNPPISAFYANYGSLAVNDTVRMNLFAGGQLIDFAVSPKSPSATNGVEAIGHGFVSPQLIDRIEFTSTENGTVLLGAFRGVLSGVDDLGELCVQAYDPTCAGPTYTPYDFAVVFGPGPILNMTMANTPYYFTIAGAIEAAQDGDELEAAPGTYNEAINFEGKAITLRGAGALNRGGGLSIIDATGMEASAVTCASGEGAGTILEGFVISGGAGTFVSGEWRGGGMYNDASDPTVLDCTFMNNQADRGSGMFNLGSHPTIRGCLFQDNTATMSGGGIHNDGSAPVIDSTTFDMNSAGTGAGGGVASFNGSQPRITSCLFKNNVAGDGAGLYGEDGAVTIVRTVLEDNTSSGDGGGVVNINSDASVTNAIFQNNEALRGGGWFEFGGASEMTNVLFAGNDASSNGGAIYVDGAGSPSVSHGTISNNLAGGLGGGVFVGNLSSLNTANSIYFGNTATTAMTVNAQVDISSGGSVSATFSLIEDDDPGAGTIPFGGAASGNVDFDPRFVNASMGNYRLRTVSPCVDAGSDDDVPPDAVDLDGDLDFDESTPLDLDDMPRFFEADGSGAAARVDMGAYEFAGCRGDFNASDSIELLDHGALVVCMELGADAPPTCRDAFDFDADQIIQLRDFSILQLNFGCAD